MYYRNAFKQEIRMSLIVPPRKGPNPLPPLQPTLYRLIHSGGPAPKKPLIVGANYQTSGAWSTLMKETQTKHSKGFVLPDAVRIALTPDKELVKKKLGPSGKEPSRVVQYTFEGISSLIADYDTPEMHLLKELQSSQFNETGEPEYIVHATISDYIEFTQHIRDNFKDNPDETRRLVTRFFEAINTMAPEIAQECADKFWRSFLMTAGEDTFAKHDSAPAATTAVKDERKSAPDSRLDSALAATTAAAATAPAATTAVTFAPDSKPDSAPVIASPPPFKERNGVMRVGTSRIDRTVLNHDITYDSRIEGLEADDLHIRRVSWASREVMMRDFLEKPRDPAMYCFILLAIPDNCLKSLDLSYHFIGDRHPLPIEVFKGVTQVKGLEKFVCRNCSFKEPITQFKDLISRSKLVEVHFGADFTTPDSERVILHSYEKKAVDWETVYEFYPLLGHLRSLSLGGFDANSTSTYLDVKITLSDSEKDNKGEEFLSLNLPQFKKGETHLLRVTRENGDKSRETNIYQTSDYAHPMHPIVFHENNLNWPGLTFRRYDLRLRYPEQFAPQRKEQVDNDNALRSLGKLETCAGMGCLALAFVVYMLWNQFTKLSNPVENPNIASMIYY